MPIYEYQCSVCGHQLEMLQSMNEPPLTVCPVCQGHTLTKLMSLAGFQLKGSGWYLTDYSAKRESKNETTKSTETTVETKPTETKEVSVEKTKQTGEKST